MIDASKSPTPAWQRYAIAVLLSLLIVVAGYVIYTKELHHTSASAPPAAPAAPATRSATGPRSAKTSATTIPGGVPVSARDPFAS